MLRLLSILIIMYFGLSISVLADALPINPDVTQETINQTICVRGWTKTVRPVVDYTNSIKRELMQKRGIPPEAESSIRLDHKIPLALGGSPAALPNLQLEEADESRQKDRVEVCLSRSVCKGKVSLSEAQLAIWNNWRSAARLCWGYSIIEDEHQ